MTTDFVDDIKALTFDVFGTVVDWRGSLIAELHHGQLPQGHTSFIWKGTDRSGKRVASGVYWVLAQMSDQKFVQKTARDYLAENSKLEVCRKVLESGQPYSAELWKGVAEMGWLGTAIPEAYGGLGLGLEAASVMLQEAGYVGGGNAASRNCSTGWKTRGSSGA